MRYRATFAAGFAVGFIAGSRAGRERYDQIAKFGRQIVGNPAVQKATRTVTDKTADLTKTAAAQMPKFIETARQKAGDHLPGPFEGKADAGDFTDGGHNGHRGHPADPGRASVNGLPYADDDDS
jgi:hypothetical protein